MAGWRRRLPFSVCDQRSWKESEPVAHSSGLWNPAVSLTRYATVRQTLGVDALGNEKPRSLWTARLCATRFLIAYRISQFVPSLAIGQAAPANAAARASTMASARPTVQGAEKRPTLTLSFGEDRFSEIAESLANISHQSAEATSVFSKSLPLNRSGRPVALASE